VVEEAVLEARQVARVYMKGKAKVEALRGLQLTVRKGEFVAIMGPSGCGKSTLLYLLGGLDRPTSGQVVWGGKDLNQLDDAALSAFRNRHVGFVFQGYNLLPDKRAWENVALPLFYAGVAMRERRARAMELLGAVGLADRADHYPSELSGGEEQRVAVARAMANRPRLILADEPTGNLDTSTGGLLMEYLCSLNRQSGVTLVIVTHNPAIGDAASRVVSMRDGMIAS
jgi:putative ABC transport system ATP-binding protein